jgi:hypothetical protein
VSAVLTDTPVNATLEAEVEASSEPIKRSRLFSYRQEKTRKSRQKRMFEVLSHLTRKMAMSASVLNVQNLTPCPEHQQNGSIAFKCHKCAHNCFAKFSDFYVCRNCKSDDNNNDIVFED